jgi:hypothetical protein
VVKQKDGSIFNDTVVQVLEFERLARKEVDEIRAGDICAIVGIDEADIGDTICDFDKPSALPPLTIDEPTLDMLFKVNDSPFAGQDGKPLTSRELAIATPLVFFAILFGVCPQLLFDYVTPSVNRQVETLADWTRRVHDGPPAVGPVAVIGPRAAGRTDR